MQRLEAQIAREFDSYQQRPRKSIGARATEYRFARYVEDWRQKVERVGNANYQVARAQKLYRFAGIDRWHQGGRPHQKPSRLIVDREKILDAAALKIVELAAPYAPFPPDIRSDTDILYITRTWALLALANWKLSAGGSLRKPMTTTLPPAARYAVLAIRCPQQSPRITPCLRPVSGNKSTTWRDCAHWENLLPTWNAFAMKVALAPMSRCRSSWMPSRWRARHRCARSRQGAANFLMWRGDHWYCDNTDGAGLVRDIETNQGVALLGKRVLLLGAGGAVRGVIGPLLLREPSALVVVNRTHATAVELVGHYAAQYPVTALTTEQLVATGQRFDVVINATSASLSGALPLPQDAAILHPMRWPMT